MGFSGPWEWLIIAGVVVLLFGARKLPQLGGAIGESIKNFKKGVQDESAEQAKIDETKTNPTDTAAKQ